MATVASLVVQIGADIADLKRNVEKVDSTLSGITSVAKKVGVGLAAAFTVDAIVGAATKVIDFAGELTDLSAKTGIGTKALQEFKYAGSQVGVSLDQVTKAVTDMQRRFAGGDASAERAVTALGLSFKDLRQLSPEDQFKTLAARIADVENPASRVKLAVDLFGKSGTELLPLLTDEFGNLVQRANDLGVVLDETTVSGMDALGDTVGDLIDAGAALLAKVLAPFVPLLTTIAEAATWLAGVLGDGLGWAVDKIGEGLKWLALQAINLLKGFVSLQQGIVDTFPTLSAHLGLTQNVAGATALLTKAEEALTGAKDDARKGTDAAARSIQNLLPGLDQNADKLTDAQKAALKYKDEIRGLADQLTGRKLEAEVRKVADAVAAAGGASKITAAEKARLGKQLDEMQAQGAALTPELHALWLEHERLHPAITVTSASAQKLNEVLGGTPAYTLPVVRSMAEMRAEFGKTIVSVHDSLKDIPTPFGTIVQLAEPPLLAFKGRASAFFREELPQAIMGAIQGGGDVIAAAGSAIGTFLVGEDGLGKSLKSGLNNLFGKQVGGFINSLLPGIGALVGPALSGLFGKLFGSAGRDAVEKFAESMGGFQSLRQQLLPLGDVGERLWVNLTQGVGKNNPQQAQAAIEAVTRALQEQKQFIDGLVPSWQDTVDLVAKYGGDVEALPAKFKQARLADTANEIAVDWRKLTLAIDDVGAATLIVKDKAQELVTESLKLGLEVPDSMRPLLDQMVKMGVLTDENGNKLTDLTRISFSESLSSSVTRIIEALDRLIAKLGGDVTTAITNIPSDIKVNVGFHVGQIPDIGDLDMQTMHSGGWITAHRGLAKVLPFGRKLAVDEVPIIAQTGEAILNRRAAAALGPEGVAALNAGGGGGAQVIDFGAVVSELRASRAEARRLAAAAPAQHARAMRDAILLAR